MTMYFYIVEVRTLFALFLEAFASAVVAMLVFMFASFAFAFGIGLVCTIHR